MKTPNAEYLLPFAGRLVRNHTKKCKLTMPTGLPSPAQQDFVVDERMKRMIAGAIAEIDLAQMAILRTLTPAERFQQMMSMIKFIEDIGAYRLRVREPELSESAALRIVRSGEMLKRKLQKRCQTPK